MSVSAIEKQLKEMFYFNFNAKIVQYKLVNFGVFFSPWTKLFGRGRGGRKWQLKSDVVLVSVRSGRRGVPVEVKRYP